MMVEEKAWLPSTQLMRLICEAMWSMWQSSSTLPTDAMLAFMLVHDFGARDVKLSELMHDCTRTRLVYQAACQYDAEAEYPELGGARKDAILDKLELVLPTSLRISRSPPDSPSSTELEYPVAEEVGSIMRIENSLRQ